MKVRCKHCLPKEGIEIPDFSQSAKTTLLVLHAQVPLHAIKYLIHNCNLSHIDAKYIVAHINKTYGRCNRCNFDKLDQDYQTCPRCGALNFNWVAGSQ